MEQVTFSNMKMANLPDELISKILDYVPLEDVFKSTQYTSSRLRRLCQEHTLPTHVDVSKYTTFLRRKALYRLLVRTAITSFYNSNMSMRLYEVSDRSICELAASYAKPLRRISMSCYDLREDSIFVSLICNSDKIGELKLEYFECRYLDSIALKRTPEMPCLRKLVINSCDQLKSELIISIVNACPNLIDVSFRIPSIEDVKPVVMHTIRKRGAQLKHLSFNVNHYGECIEELNKCSQLQTLGICVMCLHDVEFKMPIMPTVKKLSLWRTSLREDVTCILKSVPNVIEFNLEDILEVSIQTARCIVTLPYLRSVSILGLLSNKMALFIFGNCKRLKCVRADLPDLSQMPDDKIIKCFAKLHILHLKRVQLNADSIARRLAKLLPQTRVYVSTTVNQGVNRHIEPKVKRVWAEHCIFHE